MLTINKSGVNEMNRTVNYAAGFILVWIVGNFNSFICCLFICRTTFFQTKNERIIS